MTKKISEELEKYGYDRKEVKKFFKLIKTITISHFNNGGDKIMLDDLFTINLLKYDPRKNPYRAEKNYYINYYPQAKFNITFSNELRYATKHLLDGDEIEYNKQVEEKIRQQKADDGTSEKD